MNLVLFLLPSERTHLRCQCWGWYFCWGARTPPRALHRPLYGRKRSHHRHHNGSGTSAKASLLSVGSYEPFQLSFGADFWSDALFCTNCVWL